MKRVYAVIDLDETSTFDPGSDDWTCSALVESH